jgi:hypothetical protein
MHSNVTSGNVSRKGSFLDKSSDNHANTSAIQGKNVKDNTSVGGLSVNISHNGSFINQPRPQPRKPSFKDDRRPTLFGMEFNFQEGI